MAKQIRKSDTKRCAKCKEWKSIEEFSLNASMKDGRGHYCRVCKRFADRARRASPAARAAAPAAAVLAEVSGPSPGGLPPAPVAPRAPSWRGGRPTKLVPEVIDALEAELSQGHTLRASCAAAGVGWSTFKDWTRAGRSEGSTALQRELVRAVEHAEGAGERTLERIVRTSAEIDPNQARWLLERRWPEDWGRRDLVALDTTSQAPDVEVLRELITKRIDAIVQARNQAALEVPPPAAAEPAESEDTSTTH